MSEPTSPASERLRSGPASLLESFYRYFFYGWLFRDASAGTRLERATALRHNREQAKWLSVYLMRWVVAGLVLAALEILSERVLGSVVLSTIFGTALILVVLFLAVTVVCWSFLRIERAAR